MQEPSEDKSKQNRRDIHDFSEKVSQIVDTFEKLRCLTKKPSKIVDTFENLLDKLNKTDGFLKVVCQNCETLVTDFRKLKDAFTKFITFKRDNTIW